MTPAEQTTERLGGHVHCIIADLFDVSPQCVKLIINEFLYQASLEVQKGKTVDLDHIGSIQQVNARLGGAITIEFNANPGLKDQVETVEVKSA